MTDPTTTDAALTSLLADLQLRIECLPALRELGVTPKAEDMELADIDRTARAVVDLVRGLRERAETAERERDGMARMLEAITPVEQAAQGATHHEVAGLWAELGIAPLPKISSVLTTALRERDEALAACESLKDAHHRASVRIGELADQYEAVAVGTGNTRPLPEGMAGVQLATPDEIVAEWRRILRERAEMVDEAFVLRAKAEELLRLLRVAARCLRCGTCHALATVATKEPRYPDGPMGGYPYCDACGEPGRHADLPQAADVRRIAELLGETSNG